MNNGDAKYILTVNAGSSSIKLATFTTEKLSKSLEAAIENIGQPSARLVAQDNNQPIEAKDHNHAATILLDWLGQRIQHRSIIAVGHRIVHGGPYFYKTQLVNDSTMDKLRELIPFDPTHLPIEIDLVKLFQDMLPTTIQTLCFDTAFHHNLPTYARLLPIPRRFESDGIRRYGFHGLSYTYITEELLKHEGEAAMHGKVIIAHLGSGASLVALNNGVSIDTTMSLTPASGIPMSTRSGDIDPGLLRYIYRSVNDDPNKAEEILNFESGLLGVSNLTADMKMLLDIEDNNAYAKDAVDIFCYNVTKTIGAFTAALNGLNTLVFTGGMGENAPKIRARICANLGFLGIAIDTGRNNNNERLISANDSTVGVHVIRTDEAVVIAKETNNLINRGGDHG